MAKKHERSITAAPSVAVITITPDTRDASVVRREEINRMLVETTASNSRTDLTYRPLIDCILDGVLIAQEDGVITNTNESACSLLQFSEPEMEKLTVPQLISGADASLMGKIVKRLADERHVCIEGYMPRKDDTMFPAEIVATTVKYGEELLYCFFVRDVSRRKKAEESLSSVTRSIMRAKRVETAGTIAGQIAHDFNNLLTPLLAYPELIKRDLPEGCRSKNLLDVIEKTSEDMLRITQQLLDLSRRGQHSQNIFNVNDVADRVVSLLRESGTFTDVDLAADLAPDLLPIKGAAEQMLRVVQNLCQNAIDAVEQSGRVEVRTGNVYVDRQAGYYNKIPIGEYVRLTVSDNGPGIPDNIRDNIFDPFFTTRRASKRRGSGLGLSVVHGIVRDHDGLIDIETAPGKGTSFHLYFPICRDEEETPDAGPAKIPPERIQSVLVVDDDAQQREIVAGLFGRLGSQVWSVPSGERAVQFIAECATMGTNEQSKQREARLPDIVVMDVIMDPGMDGNEACKRILELHPEQKVIMVSGYPPREAERGSQAVGAITYLAKPLTLEKIEYALSQLEGERKPIAAQTGLTPCAAGGILIVDDEEGIRRLFSMILSTAFMNAKVDLAANGLEAVEAFKTGHHAVILMDLRMPVMNGMAAFVEICEHCKKSSWSMPAVVFCTGFAPSSDVKAIVSGDGMHCLLTKPVGGDDLVAAVRERILARR
jgi:PAS domain S-box-containing protein